MLAVSGSTIKVIPNKTPKGERVSETRDGFSPEKGLADLLSRVDELTAKLDKLQASVDSLRARDAARAGETELLGPFFRPAKNTESYVPYSTSSDDVRETARIARVASPDLAFVRLDDKRLLPLNLEMSSQATEEHLQFDPSLEGQEVSIVLDHKLKVIKEFDFPGKERFVPMGRHA